MNETRSLPTLAMFADLIGAAFTVRVAGSEQSTELVLSEASALPRATTRDDVPVRPDPFTLIFKAGEGTTLTQGTYVIEHASVDPFDMFVVPVGFSEYQVIYT